MPETQRAVEGPTAERRRRVRDASRTYLRLRGLGEPRQRRRSASAGAGTRHDENRAVHAGPRPARRRRRARAISPARLGWDTQLAQQDVRPGVGRGRRRRHRRPHPSRSAFSRAALTVQADSTAWAKQLQLMRAAHPLGDRPAGSPTRGSRPSASSGRTPPPGNGVPERFQGVVRAIPTAEQGKIRSLRAV